MRLLIVDDNPPDQASITRLLADSFVDIDVAIVSTPDAYEQALTAEPMELVLTEHLLSWTDGLAVLRDVQARWTQVPVIMVTASGSETLAVDGLRAGFADYIPKSSLERLIPAILRIVDPTRIKLALRECSRELTPDLCAAQRRHQATPSLIPDDDSNAQSDRCTPDTLSTLPSDQTGSKQAEAAWCQREERYRALFTAIDQGFYLLEVLFDEDNRVLDVLYVEENPAAVRLTGHSFIGRRLREISPDYEQYWYEIFGRVARTGKAERLERYARPDGIWYDFFVFQTPHLGSHQVAVLFQDVTVRKERERQISRYNRLLRGINRISEGVIRVETEEAIANTCLAVALELTDSQIGFVGEIGADGLLHDLAISGIGAEQCRIFHAREAPHPQGDLPATEVYRKVLGDGRSLIANDLTVSSAGVGVAEGVPALTSVLAVPLLHEARTIGLLMVANREDGYDLEQQEDIEALAPTLVETLLRKRAEAALLESEERFRFVATNIPDTLFFQDMDLRYTWIFNPADPMTASEVVGKTDADLLPSEEAELLSRLKRQVLETGLGTRAELYLSPGGIPHWFEAVYEPSRDAGGQLVGIVSYSRDITDRKEAEAERERLLSEVQRQAFELRGERELLQTIYDTVPAMLAIYDPQMQRITLNQQAEQLTGWTEADTTNTSIMQLAYPDPDYRAAVAAYMESLEPGYRDLEMRTKWGEVIQVSWANVGLPDGRQVGIGIDITGRRKAEQALRQSEAKFRGAVTNAAVGWAMTTAAGRFIDANPAYCALTGYSLDELKALTFLELVHPDDQAANQEQNDQMLRGETTDFVIENRYVRKDGEVIWVRKSVSLVRDDDDAPQWIIALLEDISERKRAEHSLRRYAAQLEQANEANRILLQEVNHRVKNTLTAILGLIFSEQHRLDAEAHAYGGLPRCQAALRDLRDRVRSLATVHGLLSSGQWRPLRVDLLVGEVIRESLPAASDPQSAVLDITGAPVLLSPEQAHHLALIVSELTTNTAKYGCRRGRCHISVDVQLEDGELRLIYRNDGSGYPDHILAGEGHSVGLGLVNTIATHSLRGTWSIWNDGGPVTEIRFPADPELNSGVVHQTTT